MFYLFIYFYRVLLKQVTINISMLNWGTKKRGTKKSTSGPPRRRVP